MKTPRLSRRKRALLNCAPIGEERIRDRSMRSAVFRASDSDGFANQQSFDLAVAELVRTIPIPPETAEWFSSKDLLAPSKWTWKKTLRNPAVLAVGIALLVITGVFVIKIVTRMNDFPSPKCGFRRNACSSFSFQRRETSSRGPCYGFPGGGMFIKKAGSELSRSTTESVSWSRFVAVKGISPPTFRRRNSKLKFR